MAKITFFALLMTVSLAYQAQADNFFVGYKNFTKLITEYTEKCSNTCEAPFKEVTLYSATDKNYRFLDNYQMNQLYRVASAQARVWADTILESDYVSSGKTTLDSVMGIFKNGRLVAYKIQYSERAWDVSACDYSYENESGLENCTEGKIVESSFVSLDFRTYFRDDADLAGFHD